MNNKKVQYINLLLPTILYFLLFMLEVIYGTWNHESIIFSLFYCFYHLFFVILFAVLRELYIINFVLAKDNAKVRIPGTMAFVLFLYFTF